MKRFIEGEDRRQTTLLPDTLEDYVTQDNSVRVIDVFIDELDLEVLGFAGTVPEATGRPLVPPRNSAEDLSLRLSQPHPVEPAARTGEPAQYRTDVAHRPLDAGLQDDADFRRDNGAAIRAACAQFVVLCRQLNLFTRALSPTRRAAWNCKLANRRQRVTDAAPPTPTTSRNFAIKRCASLSRPRSTTNASLTHGARAGQRKRRAGASIRQGSNKAAWRHFQPMRRASPRGRPRQGKIP